MNILALETATEACSAALWLDNGQGRCIERYRYAPREHNLILLSMIESLLAEAGFTFSQLDAIAFGRGPGSFTGVRMAAGVAQGLAFGIDRPVIPVSTLAAMALEAQEETGAAVVYPCIDARMGEVYWGVYRSEGHGQVVCIQPEQVITASQVGLPDLPLAAGWGIGSGYGTYAEVLNARLNTRLRGILPDRFPRAGCVARLASRSCELLSAEQAIPVYLRDDVAKKPGSLQPD